MSATFTFSLVQGVKRDRRRKTTASFTLLELLVVVAIIAILAAMLMPALQKVREKARQAVCISNLKQVYLGLMLYAQDFGGYLPMGWDGEKEWSRKIYELYIQNTEIFCCPSDRDPLKLISFWRTYAMVYANSADWYEYPFEGPWRFTRWISPKRPNKLLLADSATNDANKIEIYHIIRGSNEKGPALRHNGMANFVRTDGSAGAGNYDFFSEKGYIPVEF